MWSVGGRTRDVVNSSIVKTRSNRFLRGSWASGRRLGVCCLVLVLGAACMSDPQVPQDAVPVLLIDRFETASTGSAGGEAQSSGDINPPFVKHERQLLFIPFGSRVDFELELREGSVLRTRDTKVRGSTTGRLVVTWTPKGGDERVLTRNLATTEERSVPTGVPFTQNGRLTLAASVQGARPSHPNGGILLFEPEIQAGSGSGLPDHRSVVSIGGGERPNIIVYLADALRADHLGCYGYGKETSPRIDQFASSAVLFTNAQAQSSWTRPAVASLLTGLWPQQHHTISKEAVLPAEAVTLAEALRNRGYATAAVVGNGNVANIYGFSQGFSFFRYLENVRPGQPVARATEINEAVVEWLDQREGQRPFFLFIHTVDPHLPYDPPEPYRSAFVTEPVGPDVGSAETVQALGADKTGVTEEIVETLVNLYDGEVAANDAAFGHVIDELMDRGLYDSSLVVFLSDHGEEFFDHLGWTHGNTLNSEVLDIPLIIKMPEEQEGFTVDKVVDHVDLFATLLDVAGLEALPGTMGQSVLPLCMGEGGEGWPEEAFAHLDLKERFSVSLVEGRWKLILRRRGRRERVPELYDRVADRKELINLADQDQARVEGMKRRLEDAENNAAFVLGKSVVDAVDDEEMKEQLRALGYVQD